MLPYFQYVKFDKLEIIQQKMMNIINNRYGPLHGAGCKVITVDEEMVDAIEGIEELQEELVSRGWKPHMLFYKIFALEPAGDGPKDWEGGGWPIHTDGSSEQGYQNDFRLVIPIFNTDGTKTRFYECTHYDKAVEEWPGGPMYKLYLEEDCTEFTHYYLSEGPVLINTNYPHSVDGADNELHRISLGISFNRDVELISTEF